MPDLKSELQKFIEKQPAAPAPSRRSAVWSVLKRNPGVSTYELAAKTGESTAFVSTCLLSFETRGLANRTQRNGVMYHTAVGESYPEFDKSKFAQQLGLARKGVKARKTRKVIKAKPAPVTSEPTVQVTDIDTMLSKLNVIQAKELMRKLNELFSA